MAWQRIVVQVLVAGINVAAKAFMRSYQQVVANPQAAQKTVDMASVLSRRMNVAEARLVLNIKEQASKQDIDEAFKRLFEQNEVQKGGSFYLQSKVVRARESLLEEIGEPTDMPEDMVQKLEENQEQKKEQDEQNK
jgi:mitochondrial import inner membrane translocase subunit TIM16